MRSVEEQQELVRAMARRTRAETVALAEAEGRVLATDIVAKEAVPPFSNSAMDGYAVRADDTLEAPVSLRVVGDIPAGARSTPVVGPGEAARIMTGAPMPEGADAIAKVEITDQPRGEAPLPETVEIHESVDVGTSIRHAGENIMPGEPVLAAGTVLTPAALAALASVGYGQVEAYAKPRVAVITTGDELVAAGEALGFGQIPDSNSFLVAGLARRFGADVTGTFRASDSPDDFRAILDEAAANADVLVTTGGVSVGAFDVVRAVLTDAEYTPVAMQPGKPQAFGRITTTSGHEAAFLGLPGNPVSVFVSGWVFLRELLGAMNGRTVSWRRVSTVAAEGWRTPPARRQYIPVVLADDGARPAHGRGSGSHLIASLALADALAVVDADVDEVAAGDAVDAYLVD